MDFHTSPLIPDIGVHFDPQKFASTVKKAHIESVLVFAKCHHGYTYYPTKVGTRHPNLSFDLLGEQLRALRGAGVKAPVYITVGWSKLDADTHPEWRQIRFDTKTPLYYGSDDDKNTRMYFEAVLKNNGYTVTVAKTARKRLEK